MTCEQAAYTSMAEYVMKLKGYQQRQREEWELARWQIFLLMQMHPNIKPHEKAKTPQAWIPFPWERDNDEQHLPDISEEERTELGVFFKKFLEKINEQDR